MYKFIIWGTGNVAKGFVTDHYNGFFRHNMIMAFVDNAYREKQETFFNIPIISPDEIMHYDMDYILIASSYDEEITEQIVDKLHYDAKTIIHMCDIYHFMYDYWENTLSLSQKKVLCIVKNQVDYEQRKSWFMCRINVIGYVEISSLNNICDYDYDYLLLIRVANEMNYEKYIIETLHKNYNIPLERILSYSIYEVYRDTDIKVESSSCVIGNGSNSDKKFLIIGADFEMGLGAILNSVAVNIRYARENGYVPVVDMMTHSNQYLYEEELGTVNAWEKFFLQPAGYNLDDVMNSKNTYRSALVRRDKIKDRTNLFDFLKPNRQLMEFCQLMKEQLSGKKLLGVLYRGTDYANLKPYGHPIQPTLEQMIIKVKEKIIEWGCFEGIYVCTEVEEAIKEFEININLPVYYQPQRRFSQSTDSFLGTVEFNRENDKYLRGAEYFSALLWLSKCDSLVAGICGGSNMALRLNNGKYKNQYLFSLGKYGIDDI